MWKSISCSMFVTTWVSSELGQLKLNTVCIYCNTRIVYAMLISVCYAKSLLSQSYHRIFRNYPYKGTALFPMLNHTNVYSLSEYFRCLPVSLLTSCVFGIPPTSLHQLAGIQITHLREITNHVGRHSVTVGLFRQ